MSLSQATQPEFDYIARHKQDWIALQLIIEEIDEELARGRNTLLFSLANWFLAVGIFQKFQDKEMFIKEPSARDRDYHRSVLSGLLANGERLFLELRKHLEIDPKALGVPIEEISATVDFLRLVYQEWFSDMKPERKEEILREVIGGET